jgi:hypothetical protein
MIDKIAYGNIQKNWKLKERNIEVFSMNLNHLNKDIIEWIKKN